MRTSIRYLLNTVGLVALLTGCATQNEPLANSSIPAPLRPELQRPSPLATLSSALKKEGYTLDWEREKSDTYDGLTATSLPLAEVAGQVIIAERDGKVEMAQLSLFMRDENPLEDWPVCHRPPGNPANAHTIYVGYPAVDTHVDKHGDTLGFCGNEASSDESLTTTLVVLGSEHLTARVSYDSLGQPIILESGHSVGTTSLEALTTIAVDDTAQKLAKRFRDVLGEDAEPFLQDIPKSQGGLGPELEVQFAPQQVDQINPCSVSSDGTLHILCGGGDDGGGSDEPSENDPGGNDGGGNDGDGGSTDDGSGGDGGSTDDGNGDGGSTDDGNGDDGSSDDGDGDDGDDDGDDGDDDGDDGDDDPNPGPSYDVDELDRLEDRVDALENDLNAVDATIDVYENELTELEYEKQENYEELERVYEGDNGFTSIGYAQGSRELNKAEEDLYASGTIGTVGCGGGAWACAASAANSVRSLYNYVTSLNEQKSIVAETNALLDEREVMNEKIEAAEASVEELEATREQIEGDLEEAQNDLGGFKSEHGIK